MEGRHPGAVYFLQSVNATVVPEKAQLQFIAILCSDCWGNNISNAKCYGGHAQPTATELMSTIGQNWALGIVEYGAKHDVRVDFSSTHSCVADSLMHDGSQLNSMLLTAPIVVICPVADTPHPA
eukprot:SAG31_NODE_25033_length_469_cov_0.978378_1_plen_123_part_01